MKVFVSWSVDQLEGLIAASLMSDNAEELRQLSQDLKHAIDNFKAWSMAVGGSPILDLGTLGAVEVPADRMTELPAVIEKFSAAIDATLSVGIGMTLSESYSAMKFSALKGGDQISLYHAEMEDTLMGQHQPHDELEGLGKSGKEGQEEPTGFADGPSDEGGSAPVNPQHGGPNPAEGNSPIGSAPDTSPGDPGSVSIDQGSDDGSGGGDAPPGGGGDENSDDPRAAVVEALQQIKQQAPVLEQMKRTNPQAFEAVKAVVDAMILMAQGMATEGQEASGASGSAEESGGSDSSSSSDSKSESVSKAEKDAKKKKREESSEKSIEEVRGEESSAVEEMVQDGEVQIDGLTKAPGVPEAEWAVGTQKDGKVKVRHQDVATGADGGSAWRSVRAGQVLSEDGHAISARNPSGK